MGTATVEKYCVDCGQSVAGKPRTKDLQGNYYCNPCWAAKALNASRLENNVDTIQPEDPLEALSNAMGATNVSAGREPSVSARTQQMQTPGGTGSVVGAALLGLLCASSAIGTLMNLTNGNVGLALLSAIWSAATGWGAVKLYSRYNKPQPKTSFAKNRGASSKYNIHDWITKPLIIGVVGLALFGLVMMNQKSPEQIKQERDDEKAEQTQKDQDHQTQISTAKASSDFDKAEEMRSKGFSGDQADLARMYDRVKDHDDAAQMRHDRLNNP